MKKHKGMSQEEMEKRIMEVDPFDGDFPDGIYAIPRPPGEPKVKVRALANYCKEKGVEPKDLSPEEMERFLVY